MLNKEALTPAATVVTKDHVGCGGKTIDGLYVSTPQVGNVPNWTRFTTAKSAVGDCGVQRGFFLRPRQAGVAFPEYYYY